jgi:hypothetical protein
LEWARDVPPVRSADRRREEDGGASRRNDAAWDDLRAALERLLEERNLTGPTAKEQ